MSDRRVFEQGLAFYGAITASLSHEINNVLAIVNELSGLLDDWVYAEEQGRPLDSAKLKNAAGRIAGQVQNGKGFVKQLNAFAHCADHPGSAIDAGENLTQLIALCQRFARLKKLTLECRVPEQPVPMQGCAFDLQHTTFRCLEAVLPASAEGATVLVTLEEQAEGVVINLSTDKCVSDNKLNSRIAFASELAEMLGGKLDSVQAGGQALSLTLHLPRALRSLAAPAGE